MDPIDNSRAVAHELIFLALEQGVDLEALRRMTSLSRTGDGCGFGERICCLGQALLTNLWGHCITTCRGPSPCCQAA